MIEAIQGAADAQAFIAPLQQVQMPIQPDGTAAAGAAPSANPFAAMVTNGLEQVNQQLLTNQTDLQQLASGNVQNLHQIMIRMEESRVSFQLAMQVRNRLLEAYQDLMKMQV